MEVDDLVRQSNRVTEALIRIRDVVNQQNAMAAEQAQNRAYKPDHYDDESNLYGDDFKGAGGFAGAEAKKRRGVSGQISCLSRPTADILAEGRSPGTMP